MKTSKKSSAEGIEVVWKPINSFLNWKPVNMGGKFEVHYYEVVKYNGHTFKLSYISANGCINADVYHLTTNGEFSKIADKDCLGVFISDYVVKLDVKRNNWKEIELVMFDFIKSVF